MRNISVCEIIKNIKEMCIEANHFLTDDVKEALDNALSKEESDVGKIVLTQLQENLQIAAADMIPICQDTGMTVVFMEIGQDVHFVDGNLEDSIHEGVRQGYIEGYLRKSVVKDPVRRGNTGDNTPAMIYTEIVPGENVKITVGPKGFGSENMSAIRMFKPSHGIEGIKDFIIETVETAGPNPCPPIVVGVGIGGPFEKAAQLSKFALMRDVGGHNADARYAQLEDELLQRINALQIGPAGLGGKTTALAVHVEWFPTHIAGLPVAVNICCHAYRHSSVTL